MARSYRNFGILHLPGAPFSSYLSYGFNNWGKVSHVVRSKETSPRISRPAAARPERTGRYEGTSFSFRTKAVSFALEKNFHGEAIIKLKHIYIVKLDVSLPEGSLFSRIYG